MSVDVGKLDVKQLVELQAKVQAEMARKKQENKREVINQVKALLAENGMSLDDLPGRGGAGSSRPPVLPKYRNPKNPEQTWTGRGRKPLWVVEFLDKGGKMSKLAI
ncbi:MAG: H-NS family nucleoid-associated regulatory protein [Oceanococcus sp.]